MKESSCPCVGVWMGGHGDGDGDGDGDIRNDRDIGGGVGDDEASDKSG